MAKSSQTNGWRRQTRSWVGAARSLAMLALIPFAASCFHTTPTDPGGVESLVTALDPAWVSASWSGGARGAPNDRAAHPADRWRGQLCNASSTYPVLDNWNRTGGHVTIINTCQQTTVRFALCVASGSLAQPAGGLRQCATDPLRTSLSQLTFLTLNPGSAGFWYPSTGNLHINVFWCGTDSTLMVWDGRVKCVGD